MSKTKAKTINVAVDGYESNLSKDQVFQKLHSDIDKEKKLEIGIKYLNTLDLEIGLPEYIALSRDVLSLLDIAYKGSNAEYEPWVLYLNICNKVKEHYRGEIGILTKFKSEVSNFIINDLLSKKSELLDWRIVKKIKELNDIFQNDLLLQVEPKELFEVIKAKMVEAQEVLIWKSKDESIAYKTLSRLLEYFNDNEKQELVFKSITTGRFEKQDFGISNTVILGDNGGMYMLLNSVNNEQKALLEKAVTPEYLSKLRENALAYAEQQNELLGLKHKIAAKAQNGSEPIIIGKGGFGIVKFAISLLGGNAGNILCIKKTNNVDSLEPQVISDLTGIEKVVNVTLDDYFAPEGEGIYTPNMLDMSVVTKAGHFKHNKGYVAMDLVPQNTGTKVFSDAKYQKWEYQKPYLMDIFQNIHKLLCKNVVVTDLKPDNTLYDTGLREASLIDLGGAVKLEDQKEINEFNLNKYQFQFTEAFTAPELKKKTGIIDVSKSLSYACGRLLEEATKNTDCPDKQQVQALIQSLTNQNPEQRPSIEDAIRQIESIGDDYKKDVVFTNYISRIQDRLENDKSSISINDDIDQTEKTLISPRVTALNPALYKNLTCENLFEKIDVFLNSQQTEQNVLLLLGNAGSGKSISLQIKFINAIKHWKLGDSLPIYFNLANGVDLETTIQKMNVSLRANISPDSLQKVPIHLYVDSYDEGIGSKNKINLVQDYLAKLHPNSKILMSCRSDALKEDDDLYFKNKDGKLEKYYITPIDYEAKFNLKEGIEKHLSHNKTHYFNRFKDIAENKIHKLKLEKVIDTGFMFKVVMYALPYLDEDEANVGKYELLEIYSKRYNEEHLESYKFTQMQLKSIKNHFKAYDDQNHDTEYSGFYRELGKYIATQFHVRDNSRIDKSTDLFKYLNYNPAIGFKHQNGFNILNKLPLKVEIKLIVEGKIHTEEITVGFAHDNLMHCYLIESILDEIKESGTSKILATRSIVKNVQLVKLMVPVIEKLEELKNALVNAIEKSKTDKSFESITYAANAITLLVAAKHRFCDADLSNISIRGANVVSGLFTQSNFANADLTDVDMTSAKLQGAKFNNATVTGLVLGILPDLLGHAEKINSICYSPDGKYIASASRDKTVKIWDAKTHKFLTTLEGHEGSIQDVIFSFDSRYLASSSDRTIKIWNADTYECIRTSQYNDPITSLTAVSGVLGGFLVFGSGKYIYSLTYDENGSIAFPEEHVIKHLVCSSSGRSIVTVHDSDSSGCIINIRRYDYDLLDRIYESMFPDEEDEDNINVYRSLNAEFSQSISAIACANSNNLILALAFRLSNHIELLQDEETISGLEIKSMKLEGHDSPIMSMSFSYDGTLLASVSLSTIHIWDTNNGEILQTIVDCGYFDGVAWANDEEFLGAIMSNSIRIWKVHTEERLRVFNYHLDHIASLAFSPDGRHLASSSENGFVEIWNAENCSHLITLKGHVYSIRTLAFSPDGRFLACASDSHNTSTPGGITALRHSPLTINYGVDSGDGAIIKIWNADTWTETQILKCGSEDVRSIAFSHDCMYLISASNNETIRVWHVETLECIKILQHELYASSDERHASVAFSPDNKYIAAASSSTVRILDAKTFNIIENLQRNEGGSFAPAGISFSPDCKLLAFISSDDTVSVYNTNNWEQVQVIQGHSDYIRSIAFCPDGQYLASASDDGTVKIWSTNGWRKSQTLMCHTGYIWSIVFSPDAKYLASGSFDKSIKIWKLYQDGQFRLFNEICSVESPFLSNGAILDNVTNLSENNKNVFKQKGAIIKNEITYKALDTYKCYDDYMQIYQNNTSKRSSEDLLKLNKAIIKLSENIKFNFSQPVEEVVSGCPSSSLCMIYSLINQKLDDQTLEHIMSAQAPLRKILFDILISDNSVTSDDHNEFEVNEMGSGGSFI